MDRNIEIFVGTYENYLTAYRTEIKDNKVSLVQSYVDKSHSGPIKCLAVSGKYLATGGTDDRVFLFDIQARKLLHIMQEHIGSINDLGFSPDASHLLSVGEDGQMIALRLGSFQIEGRWKKAHDGTPVTNVACHPSGKLGLTLGTDLTLRSWNLVKGRVAYKTRLNKSSSLGNYPDCVSWSTEGNHFTVTGARVIEIWSLKKADVVKSLKCDSKPICVCWITDTLVCAGLENGQITMFDIDTSFGAKFVNAHESRVKAMALMQDSLVSASSNGDVVLWKVDREAMSLSKITTVNIGCRPTCIGIFDIDAYGISGGLVEAPVEEELEEPQQAKKTVPLQGKVIIEDPEVLDQVSIEPKPQQKKKKNNKKATAPKKEKAIPDRDGSKVIKSKNKNANKKKLKVKK